MHLLMTSNDLNRELAKLLKDCKLLRWVVALASSDERHFRSLDKYREKIKQLTVGIHCPKDHPDFIDKFWDFVSDERRVQLIQVQDGAFHPQLYYFEHGEGNWDCIIGSPSLKGELKKISEAAIWINSTDSGAKSMQEEISETLRRYKNQKIFPRVDKSDIEAYRSVRNEAGGIEVSATINSPAKSDREPSRSSKTSSNNRLKYTSLESIMQEDWSQYYKTIRHDGHFHIRLEAHRMVSKLFKKHGHFSDIDSGPRRAIAIGSRNTSGIDLSYYGSIGSEEFKEAIKQNNQQISKALDQIPLMGRKIMKNHFNSFVEIYCSTFEPPMKNPRNPAIRLLTFKRPDYFVCFNHGNQKKLCEAFGIPQKFKLEDYWDKVVECIVDTPWWNTTPPSEENAQQAWRCRAAFLDTRIRIG